MKYETSFTDAWLKVKVERVPPEGESFLKWCKEEIYAGKERATPLSDSHCIHWGLGAGYGKVHAGTLMLYWDGDPIGATHDGDEDLKLIEKNKDDS